ncbi:branched-chain amino acid ABC transporter permease [Phototrophicus methaneseepsis]|uniref:Branched-chain amino acid ABC transporter permease n=1 Tax=Phototrophicus methaneseepsis TaxID=2710758 RepID=A0A7S8E7U3_9CHLR|nr:branched-chain amino acid ABC transporter permease [Phototrophicus methaneseepsis]QPC81956.1 branched-chain amino acid ABC transporter permease [Phototrophicus methaneseepsis]
MGKGLLGDKRDAWLLVLGMIVAVVVFALYTSEFELSSFGITLISGLFQGMLLFLVASGLSLVFGLMDILNFAQGAYFMVGAYLAYDLQHSTGIFNITEAVPDPNIRFVIGVIVAVIVGGILGWALERFLLRPLYDRPLFQLVLTFGVSIIMLEAIKGIWNTTPYSWTDYFSIRDAQFMLFGQAFSMYRLFVIAVGLLLIFGIAFLLRRTQIGIIVRAGVEDPEMVSALGINVRVVFTLVFTLGCAVAAFGGAVAAPFLGATISLGSTFLIAAIAVIVLGGLGSYEGTAVGSIIVGLAMATMQQYSIQVSLPVLSTITPMLLLVLVLLVRPQGLFGEAR